MINLKVVIVEDDEFLLNKINKVLSREIIEVYTFKNPVEALEKIPEIVPDIIISDINMPEITGIDMYKELKMRNLDIPIILASAFSEPEYFIEAIKLKVKNFIVKPIDLEDLIEELKQFEVELLAHEKSIKRERMLRIQSKMAAMGEMLANIAHQWKQPLNTISLCASNLKLTNEMSDSKTDNKELIEDMTKNIMQSVDYMSTTINDFQNYLKPNKLSSCFYISDTLDKVFKLTDYQCKLNSIEIITNISDKSHLCSYQNELIQVLINIIKNSIDELVKKELNKKLIFINSVLLENDTIQINIKDNAGGIPEKIIDMIFEPFFTTKKEHGTGIGLHMSKQIVETHLAGDIKVSNEQYTYENENYKGANFAITIKAIKT